MVSAFKSEKLADRYQAMGDINLFVRILPYLAILTGIAGIVLVVIYLRGDRDTWDIFNLMFLYRLFFPVLNYSC